MKHAHEKAFLSKLNRVLKEPQMTSRFRKDAYSIDLSSKDFMKGELPIESYIRCGKVFTAEKNIIIKTAGRIKAGKLTEVIKTIIGIIQDPA